MEKLFLNHLNNTNKPLNNCNLILLQTGGGKTYSTFNYAMPKLFNDNIADVIIYVYPYREIYDQNDVQSTLNTNNNIHHIKLEQTNVNLVLKNIEKLVSNGKKVLITATFNSFFASYQNYSNCISNFVQKKSYKSALFIDEAHQWSTSDSTNYCYNTSHRNSDFKATAYKCIENWSNHTPYIYGLTATPTPEQQTNRVVGKLKWSTLIPPLPINDLVMKSAWLKEFKYFKQENLGNVFFDWIDNFENENKNLANLTLYTSNKKKIYHKSMLVRANTSTSPSSNVDNVVYNLVKILKKLYTKNHYKKAEYCIAEMTQYGCYIHNLNGKYKSVSEEDVKQYLSDIYNPLRYLVVVHRGKSGINIPTLKSFFDFRKNPSINNEKEHILYNQMQLIGRLQRINTPFYDVKRNGYNLLDYFELCKKKSLDEVHTLERLFETNSYSVCVPNMEGWKFVENRIRKNVSFDVKDVKNNFIEKTELSDSYMGMKIIQHKFF